jgi:hypothetical protein
MGKEASGRTARRTRYLLGEELDTGSKSNRKNWIPGHRRSGSLAKEELDTWRMTNWIPGKRRTGYLAQDELDTG